MKRLYAAYGSNLNVAAMRERCPSAVIVGTAQLADTALEYRGSAPHVYLTITEKKGATTPLGIWSVTESDEAALDSYEIFPALYRKEARHVQMTERETGVIKDTAVFLYTMVDGMPLGMPDADYVAACRAGFEDFGFDPHILDCAARK